MFGNILLNGVPLHLVFLRDPYFDMNAILQFSLQNDLLRNAQKSQAILIASNKLLHKVDKSISSHTFFGWSAL
ncbi:hypothetical protein PR048_004306 [Dryococelus australis]|uniref:Uncharacterized protein n=1 Tax=Dryococelus australis TaxID=614101 RepID=A0ABQ9I526_9NEOP|nr:hypothetical protein PR048_004306 [Dryococelus australis]